MPATRYVPCRCNYTVCVENMTGSHSIEYCSRWRESLSIALIVNLENLTGSNFLHLIPMRDDLDHLVGDTATPTTTIFGHRCYPQRSTLSALIPGCGCLVNTASTIASSTLFHVFATPQLRHSHHRGMAQLTQALFTERGPERYKKRSIGSSDLSPSES